METEVIFRKVKSGKFKGDIFALFPYDVVTLEGDVGCYMHIGQHSAADYNHCINTSIPAKEHEFAPLKRELEEDIGYNLRIVKKRNYDKYLENYYKIRKP